jgi:hypothetical protein
VRALTTCAYCGEPATSVDHVPPVLLKNEVPSTDRFCVAACKHCNCMLGCLRLFTLLDRQMWVKLRLREKYKKELSAKIWSKEELDELGRSLRGKILRMQRKVECMRRRLAFDFNTLVAILPYYETDRQSKPVEFSSTDHTRLNLRAAGCLPEAIPDHCSPTSESRACLR